jgi:hypothetical protein
MEENSNELKPSFFDNILTYIEKNFKITFKKATSEIDEEMQWSFQQMCINKGLHNY